MRYSVGADCCDSDWLRHSSSIFFSTADARSVEPQEHITVMAPYSAVPALGLTRRETASHHGPEEPKGPLGHGEPRGPRTG